MAEFVIIGGGGHARVLAVALRSAGHTVLGFTAPEADGAARGLVYLGTDEVLESLARDREIKAVIGIGKVTATSHRLQLMQRLANIGLEFPVVVAPGSIVQPDVDVGRGSVILDGAVVVTGSHLGQACIINTRASVDHDCRLGDDVHVAPGATLSGGVEVGDHCMIGAGVTVIQAVRIAPNCTIGAGATVVRDICEPGTYAGTPAVRIK